MRICVTGGIASGKSLFSRYLNECGVETLDADDIVHSLIPDPAERRRLAAAVFADPAQRRALEARLHPQVKAHLNEFLAAPPAAGFTRRAVVVPLLFEAHWENDFDIICAVVSSREHQLERMRLRRGYSSAEAEARLSAQLPAEVKAARAHYVVRNDAGEKELKTAAQAFVAWLSTRADGALAQ